MTRRAVFLGLLCSAVALLVLFSCDGESDGELVRQALGAERKLSEVRAELARSEAELARTREKLAAAEERADHMAEQLASERAERRGTQAELAAGESDFMAAFVVAFAAVAALVLLVQLLIRERRSRRTLAKLSEWLKGRSSE